MDERKGRKPSKWMLATPIDKRGFEEVLEKIPDALKRKETINLPPSEKRIYYQYAVRLADAFLHDRLVERVGPEKLKTALRFLLPDDVVASLLKIRGEILRIRQYSPLPSGPRYQSNFLRRLRKRGSTSSPFEVPHSFPLRKKFP